jgi:hypothetical protein
VFDHRIKLFDRYRNGEFDGHLHDEKHWQLNSFKTEYCAVIY